MRKLGPWGVLLLAVVVGCDGSGGAPPVSGSTASGVVKGKVTRKGKPLTNVSLNFNPANSSRTSAPVASAAVKDDGTYEVTTLVGGNVVTITGKGVGNDAKTQYYMETVDVKSDGTTHDVTLP